MVEGRTYEELAKAGEGLAVAAQQIGADRWQRFLGAASSRAVAAVSDGRVPGVIKVGGADTEAALAALGLLIAGAIIYNATRPSGPAPVPNRPLVVQQSPPEEGKQEPHAASGLAKPGEAVLSEDRREHILNGDDAGRRGGHGSGRGSPGKSEFPSDWSDEKIIGAIEEVANDPESVRTPAWGGRTSVIGSRDGVDMEVIIGRDGKAIVTAYPTNTPRNEGR